MRTVSTPIPMAISGMNYIKDWYKGKRSETAKRLTDSAKLAIEALERLDPKELKDRSCPACGRIFSETDLNEGTFYYCPHCGQALIDWLDEEIIENI